ncbi:MAG: Piwi domain-containing protein [Candidatus Heimdallarchaeota archaeon]
MFSNLYLTKNKPVKELEVDYYQIVGEKSPGDFYKIKKAAERKLFHQGYCVASMNDKIIFLRKNSMQPGSEFGIGQYKFVLANEKLILQAKENKTVLSNLLLSALKHMANQCGYIGPESQKFFKEKPFKIDYFSYHDAFEYAIQIFDDGCVGVWLDPTTRWKQSLPNFLIWTQKQNLSQEEITKLLIGRRVKCPSPGKRDYRAEIVDVNYIPINQYSITVNGSETTIYDYWTSVSQKHKNWLSMNSRRLDSSEQPVVTVQISGLDFRPSFPASLLNLTVNINDPYAPKNALTVKKILKPKNRIFETNKLFDLLLKDGLFLGKLKLEFNPDLINWSVNGTEYAKIKPLPSPELIFGGEKIIRADSAFQEIDRKIAPTLREAGPVTRIQKLQINYVIPNDVHINLEKFHDELNKISLEFNLAKLEIGEIRIIERLHPDRYMRECKQLQEINDLTVVILPSHQSNQAYISAKRGLGEKLIKSQMIEQATFNKVIREPMRAKYTLSNLAVQIYDKSLPPKESIWHLANPAGRLDADKIIYFMGFDVSRAQEKRKEAAAYAAVCDPYGRILTRKAIDTHKGEKIQSQVLSDWFFDVASSTYDESKESKKIDCIILFKDGPIPSNQVVDYRNGALDAKNRLVKEGIMEVNGDIKIISVVKRGPHRIYGKERFDYHTQNTSLIWNDKSALIVTAKAHQGTPAAIRINLDYQINDDMKIDQVNQIFNDLRYLDWSSLYKQPKTILPLHIVQNLAKLSAHDIHVPYIPR